MRKIICLLLIVSLMMSFALYVNAYSTTEDINLPGFVFSVESGDVGEIVHGVCSYDKETEQIVIPDTCNGNTVRYICEKAFLNNGLIRSVKLNNNITQIRHRAFRSCSELRSVYCPESLAVVGDYAFADSVNIKSMLLAHTAIENFYRAIFMGDSSLKYISMPSATKSIGYACYSGTAVEFINIPDGVTTIGNNAFDNNANLQEIYIPSSVTSFGTNVFKGCENVTVYCEDGSTAHQYAIDNNVKFQLIGKEEFPSLLLGDVDNSGDVNIKDVTAMQRELSLMDTVFIPDNCDINKDCRFSIGDVTYLQMSIAGLYEIE